MSSRVINKTNPESSTPKLTVSPKLQARYAFVRRGLAVGSTALIVGEQGTGKRSVANTLLTECIHGEFEDQEQVLAEPVFVYPDTYGSVEWDILTSGPIICIHHIERLSPDAQIQLFDILAERDTASSSGKGSVADFLVCTAGSDLGVRVRDGKFFPSLYFLLSQCEITIPPLRERTEDIPYLAEEFLANYSLPGARRKKPRIDPSFFKPLAEYAFPGNILELKSIMIKALLLEEGSRLTDKTAYAVLEHHQIAAWAEHIVRTREGDGRILWPPELPTIQDARKHLVKEALRRCDGNQSRAARELGITPAAVNKYVHPRS
jgi:DNA-binding NtrC family response regulator